METRQLETWHIVASGRVQGVGYRAACAARASELALRGWVRNRSDGTVEVMARGSPGQLRALCDWMRIGPPAAQVLDLAVALSEGEFQGFIWRPTV
ncbi:acylphosphatase [Cupriavidus sp. USMAA2-4]|uniref:acylphosphatase n=1 Tax=Cupriavidus malaysiensis TaxID=367825 RepID=A0ABN4TK13_9BURK|nr:MULTISPECIES: acylphosphatase [Cupriavidus]AOY92629.1 acylphosphatase [Cupriavidus sp. USMAA2-4]AOZ00920.1 acylphosphatase [Cupriavidus sp. USMAHM13]AOZ07657.1 acylphosphatase [Cupriavidus malaysiensis]